MTWTNNERIGRQNIQGKQEVKRIGRQNVRRIQGKQEVKRVGRQNVRRIQGKQEVKRPEQNLMASYVLMLFEY